MLYKDFIEGIEKAIEDNNLDKSALKVSIVAHSKFLERITSSDQIVCIEGKKGIKNFFANEIRIYVETE